MSKNVERLKEIQQEMLTLAIEMASLNGNLTPDTKQPLLYGNGRLDARLFNGRVQIGQEFFAGWLLTQLSASEAASLCAAISSAIVGVLHSSDAQAAVASGAVTVQ